MTRRPWSNAKRTTCLAGRHAHASKLEARVCDRLAAEYQGTLVNIYIHARLPLWCLAADAGGRPLYANIDFVVVCPFHAAEGLTYPGGGRQGIVRLVEAKGRVSRDFRRGAAAVEATYGVPVEIVTK